MKKFGVILFVLVSVGLFSCSKDNDKTLASITLVDQSGNKVSGIPVYAYTSDTWDLFGDDTFFADKSVVSNAEGIAEIELDDIIALFAFDNQETIYFSAHYSLNNVEKQKFVALTFKEFDEKSATITLD